MWQLRIWFIRAEKHQDYLLAVASLSPQALAYPCPAALSSPAPWDRPELGPASLHDGATHATPGNLRPCALEIPSCRQGSAWGTHSTLQLPLAKVPGRRLAQITDWSQSHGELLWTALVPGHLPSWLLVAAGSPGTRWQSCCSLLQLDSAALIITGTGQHWPSSAL